MFHSRSEEVKKLKHNVLDKMKTPRVRGQKSSLDNIPAASPINKHNIKTIQKELDVVQDKKIILEVPNNSICNSYRFLVNYG